MEHWQLVIIVLFFDRFTDVNGFFFIKPPKSDSYDPFFFHKKLTDQYGEYTYGDGRTKTYNYCFDVRHSVKNQCRPTSSWFHDNPNDIEDNPWYWSNYGSSKYPYYPNYYNHHHHHYYPSAIDDDETVFNKMYFCQPFFIIYYFNSIITINLMGGITFLSGVEGLIIEDLIRLWKSSAGSRRATG